MLGPIFYLVGEARIVLLLSFTALKCEPNFGKFNEHSVVSLVRSIILTWTTSMIDQAENR